MKYRVEIFATYTCTDRAVVHVEAESPEAATEKARAIVDGDGVIDLDFKNIDCGPSEYEVEVV